MNNADKRKQAMHCLKLAIDDYLQGGPVFIGCEAVDADYLAGGLHIALSLITVIQKIMKQLLIVENGQSTKGTYKPVKNTSKNDCYKALWQIQEILGMRICGIGEKVMEDEVDCWKLDVGRTEGERRRSRMTVKEAILTLNTNVVVACERARFDSATVKMIEDALNTIENALKESEKCKTWGGYIDIAWENDEEAVGYQAVFNKLIELGLLKVARTQGIEYTRYNWAIKAVKQDG